MPEIPLTATCRECGTQVLALPPHLPVEGGMIAYHDEVGVGFRVLSYTCGPCWERRPRTWPCTHCGGTGPLSSNFCTKCPAVRPDPLPYVPDWDLIWKEERERQREHDALVAEWDREYPGWRTGRGKTRERM